MDIVKKDISGNAEAEVVLYQPDSSIHIEVLVEGETVWLTQQQMSELFSTTRNNITLHIRNIFKEGELNEDSVCKESLRTAADGKKYRTSFHDRFLIVDENVYHIGASLKDLGKRLFAFDKMGLPKSLILSQVR